MVWFSWNHAFWLKIISLNYFWLALLVEWRCCQIKMARISIHSAFWGEKLHGMQGKRDPKDKAPIEPTWVLKQWVSPFWLLHHCMTWPPQIILTLLCSGTVVDLIQVTKLQKCHTGKSVAAGGMLSHSLVLTGLSYSWTDNLSNRDLNHFSCRARRYIYCC